MELSRRQFLGTGAAAAVFAGTMGTTNAFGANDRIGLCVIGCGGRGGAHIEGFGKCDGVEVIALCDADEKALNARSRAVEKITGKKPKLFTDIREVLQDDEIHAVSIATPNHWHTLAAIWAMQAGKDVYVEKPATHTVWEGQQLMAAAKQTGRVIQHGSQRRSERNWLRDIQLLQSGAIIGDIYMARGLCYKNGNRGDIGIEPDSEAPENLHWRLWQGPAAEKPFNKNYHPYTWHWFWDYGNGEIGNQGIHQMDVAAWGLNKGLPVKVYSDGGRFTYNDQGQTPNTHVATFTYEDGSLLVFEVRNRFTNDESGVRVGNLFYANEGYYVEDKGFFDTKDKPIPVDDKEHPYPESAGNWQNFVNAVKKGDPEAVFGNMQEAHIGCSHCHLANVSYRAGESLLFDPKTEKFTNHDEANKLLTREYHPDFQVPQLA